VTVDKLLNTVEKNYHGMALLTNPNNQLTYRDTYFLETRVLSRLTENNRARGVVSGPGGGPAGGAAGPDGCYVAHTPTLKSTDDEGLSYTTDWSGYGINTDIGARLFCSLGRGEAMRQARCIVGELSRGFVTHNDVLMRNICVKPRAASWSHANASSTVTLIDYDISTIDGKGENVMLEEYRARKRVGDVAWKFEVYWEELCES
jgi:hypothetical protein